MDREAVLRRQREMKHLSDRQLLEFLLEQTIQIHRGQKDMAHTIADLIQEVADNNTVQVTLITDVQNLLTAKAAGEMTQDQIDSAVGTLETMKQNAKTAATSIETALGVAQTIPAPPAPTPVPAPTLVLSPTSATVPVGGTQQFSATASDGSTPQWAVSPPTLGEVDANGLFTAAAAGTGTVVAETNGATISASVTVTA